MSIYFLCYVRDIGAVLVSVCSAYTHHVLVVTKAFSLCLLVVLVCFLSPMNCLVMVTAL